MPDVERVMPVPSDPMINTISLGNVEILECVPVIDSGLSSRRYTGRPRDLSSSSTPDLGVVIHGT